MLVLRVRSCRTSQYFERSQEGDNACAACRECDQQKNHYQREYDQRDLDNGRKMLELLK